MKFSKWSTNQPLEFRAFLSLVLISMGQTSLALAEYETIDPATLEGTNALIFHAAGRTMLYTVQGWNHLATQEAAKVSQLYGATETADEKFLVAALHHPARRGQRMYAGVNLFLALAGMGVAARHIWLERFPRPGGGCSAGLDYWLEKFPLSEVIRRIFAGTPECGEVQWRLLGLSIPEQTLILFLFFFVLILYLIKKSGEAAALLSS